MRIQSCGAKLVAVCAMSVVAATLNPLAAQGVVPLQEQVVSANPFGLKYVPTVRLVNVGIAF